MRTARAQGATAPGRTPLIDAAYELRDAVDDGHRTSYRALDALVERIVLLFDQGAPLGDLASQLLPPTDFNLFWAEALKTKGTQFGDGTLVWPHKPPERVSLQLGLLRAIAARHISVHETCANFIWPSNTYDNNGRAFVDQVLVPFSRDWLRLIRPHLESEERTSENDGQPLRDTSGVSAESFVNAERLAALRALKPNKPLDINKLVRLCEELNICYPKGAYFACAMLVRALLDHVPPAFGYRTFDEVINNYAGGRSFREAMSYAATMARKIADMHLHAPMRRVEALPNNTQVDFRQAVDLLLGEIISVLSST